MNLVINNGMLLTMNSSKDIYEKGMIVIDNDTISYIGEEKSSLITYDSRIIDCQRRNHYAWSDQYSYRYVSLQNPC